MAPASCARTTLPVFASLCHLDLVPPVVVGRRQKQEGMGKLRRRLASAFRSVNFLANWLADRALEEEGPPGDLLLNRTELA